MNYNFLTANREFCFLQNFRYKPKTASENFADYTQIEYAPSESACKKDKRIFFNDKKTIGDHLCSTDQEPPRINLLKKISKVKNAH